MRGTTVYADLPREYTRDGLEAYATVTRPELIEEFPWMRPILWTARIPEGPFLHATGITAEEAFAKWRTRHGALARFIERNVA